eukprot:gnl/MRDRNA2_/MRDRNA2_89059_c0_seq1.p1 gnl/MRDRNA2_/MRDRNA2_89059_c0~~gnl/MRDRNA2_/MRDRNA2_89059_c0_seq1.p1  ORF type:complete len:389 (+),score=85.03 gnl/MRDRNA2_/MRDRNA2_89059_c0_seq1:89-1255(+)
MTSNLDMSLDDMMKGKQKKIGGAAKGAGKPKGQGRGTEVGEKGLKRKLESTLDDMITQNAKKGLTNGAGNLGKGRRKGAGKGKKRQFDDDDWEDEEADFSGPRRGVQQRKTWGFGVQFRAAQKARGMRKGGSGGWEPAVGSKQRFNRVEEKWGSRPSWLDDVDDRGEPPRKRPALGGGGPAVGAWAVARAAVKDASTDQATRDFTKVSGGPKRDFRLERRALAEPDRRRLDPPRGMKSGEWRDAAPIRRDYREPEARHSGAGSLAKKPKYAGHSFDVSDEEDRAPPPRERGGRAGGRMGRDSPPPAKQRQPRQEKGTRDVRVAGIAPSLSSRAVREAFESSAGPVESFSLKNGVAWLSFTKPGDAVRAVEMFNQGQLNGRTIVVTLEN